MNRQVFILLCIFILSRLIFINPLPIFFDSPEYLERFSNPNYFQAIASGHTPFHSGYIMLLWPIFQAAAFLGINSSVAVIFAQIIISTIGIYCFYQFLAIAINKKISLIATIIASLTPLYWITNISIMMESVYINFFLMSLFLFAKYGKSSTHSRLFLFYGSVCFGFAFLTHPLIILWLPFLLFTVYLYGKEKIFIALLTLSIAISAFGLLNSIFISKSLQISLASGVHKYLLDKLGEHVQIKADALSLFIIVRNTIIPLLRNNTILVVIISLLSLVLLLRRNKRIFILGILWIAPAFISNQWWDSLFFGRHSAISGFGFAFIAATFLKKRKILTFIFLAYILIVSLPALSLLKQPIPYLEEQKFVKSLPKGLLIESHFARPQVEGHYSGKTLFVNEPGWNKKELEKIIDTYLITKQPVFITSQALTDPYGLYSGPFLHPLSLSYARKFELDDLIPLYSIKKYSIVDKHAGLTIYKIISKEKSKYPDIPKLNYNRHRIDYFDPISQLGFFIDKAKIIQIHNMVNE